MLISVAASCGLVESVDVDVDRGALLGLFVVGIEVGRGSGTGAGTGAQFFLHDRHAKAQKRVTGVERTDGDGLARRRGERRGGEGKREDGTKKKAEVVMITELGVGGWRQLTASARRPRSGLQIRPPVPSFDQPLAGLGSLGAAHTIRDNSPPLLQSLSLPRLIFCLRPLH